MKFNGKNGFLFILCMVMFIVAIAYKYYWQKPHEIVNSPQPQAKPTLSIEKKAYRVETTARKAPNHYNPIQIEIWDIREKNRIAQAKIRMQTGMNVELFRTRWSEYKNANLAGYKRLSILQANQAELAFRDKVSARYGEKSNEFKKVVTLLKQKRNKQITSKEFRREIKEFQKSSK